MAIETDDCDIREVYMQTMHGGNGDYYITLYEYPNEQCSNGSDKFHMINYRMAMSGGFTSDHPEVREAFVALFRAMEKAGLNNHPKSEVVVCSKSESCDFYMEQKCNRKTDGNYTCYKK